MIKIDNLISALKTLKTGFELFQNNKNPDIKDMLADSCVKRFEYTLETSIKLMKKFLKQVYFIDEKDLTVNNVFRLMQGYNFIISWENWRNYYQKRNDTSHEYNIQKSRDLLKIIPDFIKGTEILVENLNVALTQNEQNQRN